MRLIAILFFICFSWEAVAQEQTKWDVIVNHPSVVSKKMNDNGEVIEVTYPGPVVYSKEGDGILSVDRSNLGAVWCAWEIYNLVWQVAQKCEKDVSEEAANDFLYMEESLDNFIVENNPIPTSIEDLKNRRTKILAKFDDRGLCEKNEFVDSILLRVSMKHINLKEQIDKLVSIPRPPVMNPCL